MPAESIEVFQDETSTQLLIVLAHLTKQSNWLLICTLSEVDCNGMKRLVTQMRKEQSTKLAAGKVQENVQAMNPFKELNIEDSFRYC